MIEKLSRLFKALSDETRLRILTLLVEREYSVNELASIIGTTQPNISFHLGILLQAGLISGRGCGKNIFYFAAPDDVFKRFIVYGIYEAIGKNPDSKLEEDTNSNEIRCKRRLFFRKEDPMNGKRGGGYGCGRGAQGPSFNCICNKCGTKIPHTPGVPCREERCPKCGTVMVREGSPHDRWTNKTKGESNE